MTTESKKPTHRVLVAKKFKNSKGEEKTHWLTIGSAWLKQDGEVIRGSGKLDTLPIDGRFVISPDEPKPTNAADDFQPA